MFSEITKKMLVEACLNQRNLQPILDSWQILSKDIKAREELFTIIQAVAEAELLKKGESRPDYLTRALVTIITFDPDFRDLAFDLHTTLDDGCVRLVQNLVLNNVEVNPKYINKFIVQLKKIHNHTDQLATMGDSLIKTLAKIVTLEGCPKNVFDFFMSHSALSKVSPAVLIKYVPTDFKESLLGIVKTFIEQLDFAKLCKRYSDFSDINAEIRQIVIDKIVFGVTNYIVISSSGRLNHEPVALFINIDFESKIEILRRCLKAEYKSPKEKMTALVFISGHVLAQPVLLDDPTLADDFYTAILSMEQNIYELCDIRVNEQYIEELRSYELRTIQERIILSLTDCSILLEYCLSQNNILTGVEAFSKRLISDYLQKTLTADNLVFSRLHEKILSSDFVIGLDLDLDPRLANEFLSRFIKNSIKAQAQKDAEKVKNDKKSEVAKQAEAVTAK